MIPHGMGEGAGGVPPGGAAMMPGGSRPLPGPPGAFNPAKHGAGGPASTVELAGQRRTAALGVPPEESDPDFTGDVPLGGGGNLGSRALEQARAALHDAERALQEAERAKKAAILAGRQQGVDLTKELPDARTGPTSEISDEAEAANPSGGASGGHKSAGGNGPAIGIAKKRGGGTGSGNDGEGADELPDNMEEDASARRASSWGGSRIGTVDDGEGGRPDE